MSLVKDEQNNVTYIEGMPLLEYCKFISNSQLIPKSYKGKPEDIFLAIMMGKEIGLKPLQALKSISVINSTANIYGDAAISLVQAHPQFEDIKEYFDEKLQAAVCIIKRKNQSEHTVVYSIEDAKKAGLWGKPGPWQQYPRRMLQMRSRGFALRDRFADALGGLILVEEAQDYPIDVTPKTRDLNSRLDHLLSNQVTENSFTEERKSPELKGIEDVSQPELTFSAAYMDLMTLIGHYNVSEELQKKWCDAAGVEYLIQLNDEQIKGCIKFIETKYANNDSETKVELD